MPRRACRSAARLALEWSLALACVGLLASCRSGTTRCQIYFADGLERLALGDSAAALQLFHKADYECGGKDAKVLFHLGRLLAAKPHIEDRVKAQAVLRQAVRTNPGVGLYRSALGELLRKQRYPSESTRQLLEGLELDPDQPLAWRSLGYNLQEKYFDYLDEPALLDSAMQCYERALELNPEDRQSRSRLAFLWLHKGGLWQARALLQPVVEGFVCTGREGLLLAAVEYQAKNFRQADRLVKNAMDCMTSSERRELLSMAKLMHPDSVGVLNVLEPAEVDSMCQHYWWANDPTPTTRINERFLEHVSRVVQADFMFELELLGKRGLHTDRGEVFVRYGEPVFMKRLHRQWLWAYGSGDQKYYFRFLDQYLNGDFMRERRGTRSDFSRPTMIEAIPAATQIAYPSPEGGWKYRFYFFRGTDERTAVEIAYELAPGEAAEFISMEAAAWSGPGQLVERQNHYLPMNELHELAGGERIGRMRFEIPAGEQHLGFRASGLKSRVSRRTQPSMGDKTHEVTWTAFGRDTMNIADLTGDRLALSDLMLAHEIRRGSGGPFDVGNIIVVPRVDDAIRGDRVHLYFEIYPTREILDEQNPVAVTYEIRALPPKKWGFWDQFKTSLRRRRDLSRRALVQSTFVVLPSKAIEQQQLTIDVGALQRGFYGLEVILQDTLTGERVSRSTAFELIVEAGPES